MLEGKMKLYLSSYKLGEKKDILEKWAKEKDNKIQQRHHDCDLSIPFSPHEVPYNHDSIDNSHPFHLDRNNIHEKYLHIRISNRKRQEYGHIDIACTKSVTDRQHRYRSTTIDQIHHSIENKCS